MNLDLTLLARALLDRCKDATAEERSALIRAALGYLEAHGSLSQWRKLPSLLRRIERQEQGLITAELTLADKDPQAAASFKQLLETHLKTTVDLSIHSDPELLGGERLSFDDERFDFSLRTALKQITSALTS